jgi:hypothetical protein
MKAMSAINYPVAETAEQAMHRPLAHAERAREAAAAAGGPVEFVTEAVGPAFATEAAAEEAYRARSLAPGEWRSLRPIVESKPPAPLRPVNRDGRRWPEPRPNPPRTVWRLSISYWRVVREAAEPPPPPIPARKLRRDPAAGDLGARDLNALARQPLRAARPQQPLDIGLFEVRLPEAPDRIVPDD